MKPVLVGNISAVSGVTQHSCPLELGGNSAPLLWCYLIGQSLIIASVLNFNLKRPNV